MWKGTLLLGTIRVPVKLYSAASERPVRFRLLHKADKQPVRQELISSESGEVIEFKDVRKAWPLDHGRMVVLEDEELEELEPEESRDIEVLRFVGREEIDHAWYQRPYYLGPDGNTKAYFAAAAALENKEKEGLVRWVMRGKQYVGALVPEEGYLTLITLRHAEEILDDAALKPPGGRDLLKRELEMAEQLVTALHAEFDPSEYHDQFRKRVMELVETKAEGGKPKLKAFRPRKAKDEPLADALEASLAGLKKRKHG